MLLAPLSTPGQSMGLNVRDILQEGRSTTSDEGAVTTSPTRSITINPFLSLHRRVRSSLTSKSHLHLPRSAREDIDHGVAAAQHLPQELLIIIIGHLATPFYLAAFAVGGLLARYYRDTYTSSRLHDARRDLLAVVRVCLAWNVAGTQVLYARPFLMSPKQVQLFSWSLKENPSLGTLVKKIFVLQPERGKVARLVSQVVRTTSESSKPNFASSMVACTSLETLTFTLCPKRPPVFSAWDTHFIRESGIGEHLRELAIYGTSHIGGRPMEFLTSELVLPSLEVLVLKSISLKSGHRFPFLPKLRFLRIAMLHRVHEDEERFTLGIYSSRFPSLQTLILHHTGAFITIDDRILGNLEDLRLCGTSERECYQCWVGASYLDSVTKLEFHLNEVRPGAFVVEKYPPRLQSLTLEVTFARGREMKVIKAHVLEDFQRTFRSATEDCKDLAYLAIKCHSTRTEDTSQYDAVMEQIRLDCEFRGIELEEKGPRLLAPATHENVYRRLNTWPL